MFSSFLQASDSILVDEITSAFNMLVKEVDGIFKTHSFGSFSGYDFRVDRVQVIWLAWSPYQGTRFCHCCEYMDQQSLGSAGLIPWTVSLGSGVIKMGQFQ